MVLWYSAECFRNRHAVVLLTDSNSVFYVLAFNFVLFSVVCE